jgi:hypothetical protein
VRLVSCVQASAAHPFFFFLRGCVLLRAKHPVYTEPSVLARTHLVTHDVVFNDTTPKVGAILARVREDYSCWRQARIFRSDFFGLVEPLSLFGGE